MISSFKTSFANTDTSPQIVPDGQSRMLLTVSDSSAQRLAKLQAAGKPWLCVKHKITVTNDKCRSMKIAGDTRQCADCGLPLSLGIVTREELRMGKSQKHTCPACGQECLALLGKRNVCWTCREEEKTGAKAVHTCLPTDNQGRVVPASKQLVVEHPMMGMQDVPKVETVEAFPSWDDFEPVSRVQPVGPIMANVQKGDRITLSTALILALGWPAGTPVECRISKDKQQIAIRKVDSYQRGSQYKLTSGSRGRGLAINCNAVLRATETPGGSYDVDVTSWGCIVRTDKPLVGKA